MIISKNKTKYLASLKVKKFRDEYGQFIAEGDKIVSDTIRNGKSGISMLAATTEWLDANRELAGQVKEVYEANIDDLGRISSFETAPPVIAVFDISAYSPDYIEISESLSIGLDSLQDPGNLGTIIRTADWFGIGTIFCSPGCADVYNPKTIQASMGAVFNVKVHYIDFNVLFERLSLFANYIIAGTFMQGELVSSIKGVRNGMLLFGNESRGINGVYDKFITKRVTIPPVNTGRIHVESLNVASSVAAALAMITETNQLL